MKTMTLAAMLLAFASKGCNTATEPDTTITIQADTSPEALLKKFLNEVGKTGEIGSGESILQSEMSRLKGSSPAKAQAIEPDVEALLKLKTPAEVKAKASEISAKL